MLRPGGGAGRVLAGVTVVAAVAAAASLTVRTETAEAALDGTGSCVDGGGVTWRTNVVWREQYRASDGTYRIRVDHAGWTTRRAGAVPTDSVVRTYDGAGRLLQKLTRSAAFDYRAGIAYDARNPLDPVSAPGTARITITLGVDGDGRGNCTVTAVQPTAPVVAAAGDIACAPGGVVGTTCRHKAVSDSILADRVGTVLTLGDNQYETGALSAFQTSFHPTWGRFKSRIRPAVGNHEYATAGAAGYFDYFGAAAGSRSKGYYSFDVGAWHFVAINSERDLSSTGAQLAWLKADLAAHPNKCVAAYWHKPRWSSGAHGDNASMGPFVRALYDANAELILSGHDHDYERFHPMNPSGVRDSARGVVQIVSGNGGKNHYPVTGRATTATKDNTSYGYTRLVLHADSVDVAYVPAYGSYRDFTRIRCH